MLNLDIPTIAQCASALATLLLVGGLYFTRSAMKQSYEQEFVREYRRIISRMPYDAVIGKIIRFDDNELMSFYRYFDLSNEQLFYKKKLSRATREEWEDGIKSMMELPAFRQAWAVCKSDGGAERFKQLTALVDELNTDSNEIIEVTIITEVTA